MSKSSLFVGIVILSMASSSANAAGDGDVVKQIAQIYRACGACHSLKPGIHLSGPSLAGLWGKKAGSVAGFGRYTEVLKKTGVTWDEDTLNAWLANPQAMAPGTTMMFRGIENDQTRNKLIAFLRMATAEGGAKKVVEEGLIPEELAEGQTPQSLKEIGPKQQIVAIRHCGDAYHVTTAEGEAYPFWETNVRLKIDTSVRGPAQGRPVLLRSGMAGDRVSVVFSSLDSLRTVLIEKCDG